MQLHTYHMKLLHACTLTCTTSTCMFTWLPGASFKIPNNVEPLYSLWPKRLCGLSASASADVQQSKEECMCNKSKLHRSTANLKLTQNGLRQPARPCMESHASAGAAPSARLARKFADKCPG